MAHLYKLSEWQSSSGNWWYCEDVSDLAGPSAKWWAPARVLGLSLTDFILLLRDKYHATIGKYNPDTDYLDIKWVSYSDMHKYVLYVNKVARSKNFMV